MCFLIFVVSSYLSGLRLSHCQLFPVNSFALLIGSSSSFLILLKFSSSMNLAETVIYCGPGGLFLGMHPYLAYMGLIFLVEGLFLLWMTATSFLSVCWSLFSRNSV